jgi:hypothetical protein
VTQDLTRDQVEYARAALDTGYLRLVESAYAAHVMTDYRLFAGGKLVGKAKGEPALPYERANHAPPMRNWRLREFHAAEARAVPPVPRVAGRAAYGCRRAALDAANAAQTSMKGIQALGGWTDPTTPQAIYAESENRAGRQEARDVRAKLRGESE